MTAILRGGEANLVDESGLAHACRVVLVALLTSTLAVSALTLVLRWPLIPQLTLAAAASCLVALVLSRSGRLRPAMFLALLGIAYVILHAAVRFDGMQSIGLAILPFLITLCALLLTRLMIVFFTAAVVLAVSGMLATRYFVLRVERYSTNDMGDLFIFALTCATAALVGRLLAVQIDQALGLVRNSESRYRRIFENVQDVYYEMRPDGMLLELSPASATLFGVSRDAMIGRPLVPFCVNESELAALLAAVHLHGRVSNHELVIRDSGAALHDVLVNASLQTGFKAGEERVIGSIREITERKRTEEQLRRRAEELEKLMDVAPVAVFVAHDPECRQITGNRAASGMVEASQGANLSATLGGHAAAFWRFLRDGVEVPREELPMQVAARSGTEVRDYELEALLPSGARKVLWGHAVPLHDAAGQVRGAVGAFQDITLSKQRTESVLRETEERFRATFFQAAVGIAQTGTDGKWLLLNDPFCKMLGYSRAELFGQTFLDVTHPDDREASLTAVRQLLAGEISWRMIEKRYVRKDGAIVWGRVHVSLVRDKVGVPQYFITVVEDVTDRVQAEHALRVSERRLAVAESAARLGVWEADLDTNITAFFGDYTTLYGLRNDHPPLSHKEWIALVHPADRDRVESQLTESVEQRRFFDAEFRVVWPDGSVHWLLGKGTVLLDDTGRPIRMAGVNLDITARKQAEADLRESEERFRNMADSAPVMIWVSGPDKLFTFFNRTWLDFRGRTLEQELGRGWAEGVHPDDLDRCFATFSSAFDARRDFQIECRLRRADGEYRWLLCSGIPRFAPGGVFLGYIGSDIDITDQKRAEAELRRHLDEITHLNRVAALGELTASLAHELNQPLAAILMNAQAANRFLTGDSPDLAEVHACLTDIAADDKRAGEVVNRLRGLLKKGESEASLVDLNEVVIDALRLVSHDALLRQASVKFEPLPGLAPVLGDRVQLCQVVLNLVMNGLDASAERPPSERWILVRTVEADGGVELTVEDSGKGIAESDLVRVFEPFFSTKPAGLGMGLSISRSIVQAHGGRLWGENSLGGGAIFRCVLPVVPPTVASAAR